MTLGVNRDPTNLKLQLTSGKSVCRSDKTLGSLCAEVTKGLREVHNVAIRNLCSSLAYI
jgi:hypothetical protein